MARTQDPPLPPRQSDIAAAIIGDATPPVRDGPPFLVTKEHRRFVEFADAVRRNRYIGVCYGPPGIGKTLSARTYSGSDDWEQWFCDRYLKDPSIPAIVDTARTAMWTPKITTTPKELDHAIPALCQQVSWAIECHNNPDYDPLAYSDVRGCGYTELLIIDEADRLKTTGLEQLRDFFDRHHLGLILIGMPGLERRLERYPQLYSRIGFAHQYRPLGAGELTFELERHWNQLGLALNADDFTDNEAIAAVARITGGNFRLIQRLFGQVQRILEINNLHTITSEVIDAAGETLVIGTETRRMLTAICTCQHDLHLERTLLGLHAARELGRRGGRPAALTDTTIAQARTMKSAGAATSKIAEALGVSRSTVYRYLNSPDGSRRAK